MGCDIHFYVERRDGQRWMTADKWTSVHGSRQVESVDSFYFCRDYPLFAILANVRNVDDLLAIDYQRGVPDDCSEEYRSEVARWEGDGHSHSWLTLREILTFDWTMAHTLTGWVGPLDWYGWTQRRRPNAWLERSPDDQTSHRTNADFERAMAALESERRFASLAEEKHLARFCELTGCNSPVTEITWHVPYYDLVGSPFWTSTIPRLLALSRTPCHDDVRAVFFFDN